MQTRSLIAVSVLAGLIVLLLLLQTPLLAQVRGQTWDIVVHRIARLFNVGVVTLEPDVAKQLSALQSENARLHAELRDYTTVREQLGTPTFTQFRTIPAAIAARPIDTFQLQYILNRGARDGVTLGAPVVVHGSTLIGFVTTLHERTSVVQLLLHPSTSLAVEIQNETPTRGLLAGHQYTALAVTTIPRDSILTPGQSVVSLARDGLPFGLLIGRLATIERAENEAYQQALVTLPYDPDHLQAVQILVAP